MLSFLLKARHCGSKGWGTRRFLFALGIAVVLTNAVPADGPRILANTSPAEAARARVAALLKKQHGGTQTGLLVVNADDRSVWVAQDEALPLKPASVLKLFTTAAALLRFGPDFAFETPVYTRGDEVWIIGSGDPALGDERLTQRDRRPRCDPLESWSETIAENFRGRTLARIVLDDSVFDHEWRNRNWPAGQWQEWYAAPVGGLNLNDNCLDARLSVGKGRVSLALTPALPAEFVSNELFASKEHRPVLRRDADSDLFEFKGPVSRSGPFDPISVNRPTVFFGHALRIALGERGLPADIPVVRRALAPSDIAAATRIASHRTPLRDVLWRCNTFSQNLFAECLLKALAAYGPDGRRTSVPGSWKGGTDTVIQTLWQTGLDLEGFEMVDGSGLSHNNRVTARHVVDLLVLMRNRPGLGEVFAQSLAQAGQDGTLKRRFSDAAFAGRLTAKTGTLSGVHTLAGYIRRPDGVTLAFALLQNGRGDADIQRDICRILVGDK